jgi:hypothetical protein
MPSNKSSKKSLSKKDMKKTKGGVAAGDVNGDGLGASAPGIISPRDSASGLPTGKRQHKPFGAL